jgi:hypothetical protein
LNGYLEEEVYVEQPIGYVVKRQEGKVFKLKKALYGQILPRERILQIST